MALLKAIPVQPNTKIVNISLGGGSSTTTEGSGLLFKISLTSGQVFNFTKFSSNSTPIDSYLYKANGDLISSQLGGFNNIESYTASTNEDVFVHALTSLSFNSGGLYNSLTFQIGSSSLLVMIRLMLAMAMMLSNRVTAII